jgi:hypothetical protein
LQQPLTSSATTWHCFASIKLTALRFSNGKSPGPSGWTRELLAILLQCTDAPTQQSIEILFNAITEASSGQVVVNRIEESNGQMIRIEGWAIADVAAERFADSLSTALRPLGLVLAEPPILSEKQGRLGLAGYAIEVRFGPASSVAGPHLLTQLTETRP